MSSDPGDLANLSGLALPPAISFWPPAAGIRIVGGAVVAALIVAGWRAFRRYRADAYLRDAITEIDAATRDGGGVGAISAILKRAALVAYGRERVASLTGPDWASFVRETAPTGKPVEQLAAGLQGLFAKDEQTSMPDRAALSAGARAWLRGQRGRAPERR